MRVAPSASVTLIEPTSVRTLFRLPLTANEEAADRRIASQKTPTISDFAQLDSDAIEIEEPTWWDLGELCEARRIEPAAEIRPILADHQFWLVQVGFSLIPAGEHWVSWARFLIKLAYDGQMIGPSAYSLLPGKAQPAKGSVAQICIGTDFRFYEAATYTDKPIALFGYERSNLTITGAGNQSSKPSWDIRGRWVRGHVRTYIVVRKRKNDSMRFEFVFNASRELPRGVIKVGLPSMLGGVVFCFDESIGSACRKSYPDILVVQSTEMRLRENPTDCLNSTRNRRVFIQR